MDPRDLTSVTFAPRSPSGVLECLQSTAGVLLAIVCIISPIVQFVQGVTQRSPWLTLLAGTVAAVLGMAFRSYRRAFVRLLFFQFAPVLVLLGGFWLMVTIFGAGH